MPTIRLSRKDNDILSRREWHLLFNANPVSASTAVGAAVSGGATRLMPRHHVHPQIATSQVVTSTFASQDAGLYSRGHEHDLNGGQDLPTQIPLKFSWDTFLIKTYFSEVEKSYLVLLTNLKQCWFEKLNLWDIRERSKRIKSFAYDEDSQIEALILSLSTIFTEEQEKDKDAFSIAQRRLDKKPGNALSLFVGFKFGLATVQWEFKLLPMIPPSSLSDQQYNMNNAMTTGGHLFENESGTKANGSNVLHSVTTTKRRRLFLEDSDDDTPLKDPHQPIDENSPEDSTDDENDNGDDSDSEDDIDRQGIGAVNTFIQEGLTSIQESQERSQRRRRRRRRAIDGPTALFDHLVSPLISVTNAYKKQVRMLEAIIKSKENEVFEALEIMEQSGVNHHNRRRVTQPYQKGDMETKLQSDLEAAISPQVLGPKELFAEKKIPLLCSIVSKSISEQKGSLNSQVQYSASQLMSSLDPSARSLSASQSLNKKQSSLESVGAPNTEKADNPGSSSSKVVKESEELERRRVLQEQIEKERTEKEKRGKKKKLF